LSESPHEFGGAGGQEVTYRQGKERYRAWPRHASLALRGRPLRLFQQSALFSSIMDDHISHGCIRLFLPEHARYQFVSPTHPPGSIENEDMGKFSGNILGGFAGRS